MIIIIVITALIISKSYYNKNAENSNYVQIDTTSTNIEIKYDGYIKRQQKKVESFKKLEGKKLDKDFDYSEVSGLRKEAIQKLNMYKPLSIGQASRISGVSPADISVLLVFLEQLKHKRNNNDWEERKK